MRGSDCLLSSALASFQSLQQADSRFTFGNRHRRVGSARATIKPLCPDCNHIPRGETAFAGSHTCYLVSGKAERNPLSQEVMLIPPHPPKHQLTMNLTVTETGLRGCGRGFGRACQGDAYKGAQSSPPEASLSPLSLKTL